MPVTAQASFFLSPGMLAGRSDIKQTGEEWPPSAVLAAAHVAQADPPGFCSLWLQGYKLQVRRAHLCRHRLQRLSHNLSEHKDGPRVRWGPRVRNQGHNAVMSQKPDLDPSRPPDPTASSQECRGQRKMLNSSPRCNQ